MFNQLNLSPLDYTNHSQKKRAPLFHLITDFQNLTPLFHKRTNRNPKFSRLNLMNLISISAKTTLQLKITAISSKQTIFLTSVIILKIPPNNSRSLPWTFSMILISMCLLLHQLSPNLNPSNKSMISALVISHPHLLKSLSKSLKQTSLAAI